PVENTNCKIVNEVTSGTMGSGDNVYGYSAAYSDLVYLRGTYGQYMKRTIKFSTPVPALDLALSLAADLQGDSITVSDIVTTAKRLTNTGLSLPTGERTIITTIESPQLAGIVHWFNQKSMILYGEALLKAIGGIS